MPHSRKRTLVVLIEKRLKLFPIVGILGARQIGKSTTIREQLSLIRKIKYITLDRENERVFAQNQPSLFLENAESKEFKTVCIDEVQKAPNLFDTLKAFVDEKRYPGRFLLSGSTEFSKKTNIQESLTGRISLLRLFPLNLKEIYETNQFSLKEVKKWCEYGGMPGIFAIRDQDARIAMINEWLETSCSRDLANFRIRNFNPELARRIIMEIAICTKPTHYEISKNLGKTPRQIKDYLEALKALFIIYEIEPHPSSVGKSLFFLFDSGIAHSLGASSLNCLRILFLNEVYSYYSYSGALRPDVFHYETSRGSTIDFIVNTKDSQKAFKIFEKEAPNTYDLRSVSSFEIKHPKIKVDILCPCTTELKISKNSKIIPWGRLKFD